ncbi:hypothetical protein Tco_0370444 [Tanacetum coccineum]
MQSPSGSGSLPGNTIANPRGDLKAITTRSGVSYDGPMILPTSSPLPKEVECEPEATKDKVQTISTAHVQPPVVQVPIPEPDVAPKPNPKPSIPYPSRLNDQKLSEKANNQMLKFLQIFQRLHFDLSFADALLHMPKFASTFKSLPSNKEKLFELENTPLNENCSAVLLKSCPKNLETPAIDYDVDPRVPLHLERPFLRTARALVDVFREELILRDEDEKLIFHGDNTSKHPQKHANESINMINFIDITCEDRFPEEFADELALLDPFPPRIGDADFDSEGDILLLEKGNSVTLSNPLFDTNDDFTSSNDESLPGEDVPEENFKIYSNPLFEFDDEYISSSINPLFNEMLEDIENKDSYVSNLDEPVLLVTPLSDEDECLRRY